jgi:hypothetical protein
VGGASDGGGGLLGRDRARAAGVEGLGGWGWGRLVGAEAVGC